MGTTNLDSLTLSGSLAVNGGTIDNGVVADDPITFQGDVDMEKTLDVTGAATVGGTLEVTGKITATAGIDDLTINDDLTVAGDLILDGATVSEGEGVVKFAEAALTARPNTNETDTTIVLPAKSIILDVFVDVTTAEVTGTTKTIDVGIKTVDQDGLLDGVATTPTGLKKGTLVSTGQTKGALLRADESGAGVLVPEVYAAGGTVTYTAGSAQTEFVGKLYVVYIDLT